MLQISVQKKKENTVTHMIREIGDNKKYAKKKEIIVPLDIRAGIIRLPKIVTDLSEFILDDEIVIEIDTIIIKKHKIDAKQQ